MSLLADVHSADLEPLFVLLALVAFAAAIYMAYLRNWLATVLLVLVAVVILIYS